VTTVLFATYSGLIGGAERVLLDCAAGLDGNHFLACPAGPLADAAQASGMTVFPLAARSLRLRGRAPERVRAAAALGAHARELRRLSCDLDADLVVAWGMRSALAALALGRRIPYAVDHHDFLPGPVVARLVRAAARRARVVTVPSRAVAEDLDPQGALTGLRIVAPGVDVDVYEGIGAPPTVPRLITVGAITTWKRPDLALEILALARRERPDLELCIVGGPVTASDEDLVRELQARALEPALNGAVTFTGAVAAVGPELARASCLLHCAAAEPFGIALLEALAAGRPVVAPDAAGPREIVDSSCGVLFRPDDPRAGAAAVVGVLADPERAAQMGAAGRERIRRQFSREQTRQRFADALAPALVRAGTSRPSSPAELAILTVTHNSAKSIPVLIASIQRHLPGVPLTVVDCASTDDSVSVAEAAPATQVIALEANVGFGRACNRGLRDIAAPVTALLNPDVELLDDSLLALAAEARRSDRPERLLTPLVVNEDGTRQQTAHPVPGATAELVRALIPAALVPGPWLAPWRARAPRRVGWAVGAALLARTDTLRRLGPFDESIFMYGEDLDLGLRAATAGIPTCFWPSVRVRHTGGHATTAAFGGEPFGRLAQARHEAIRRNLGPRRARRDVRVQVATFACRAALRRALGRSSERQRQQLEAVRAVRRAP
jgi:glycosyltransferase involved in cell wall biosynthesis/GT2 family glycosyltransferase